MGTATAATGAPPLETAETTVQTTQKRPLPLPNRKAQRPIRSESASFFRCGGLTSGPNYRRNVCFEVGIGARNGFAFYHLSPSWLVFRPAYFCDRHDCQAFIESIRRTDRTTGLSRAAANRSAHYQEKPANCTSVIPPEGSTRPAILIANAQKHFAISQRADRTRSTNPISQG